MYHSQRNAVTGWRYLWAKTVVGFRPGSHCAGCLRGSYELPFGLEMKAHSLIHLPGHVPGDILYFCGVASPYVWANNMHLAVRVTGQDCDMARVDCYNGDTLTVLGAVAIPFDDKAALRDYPARGPAFLTCRNFQFGSQMRAEGVI